MTDQNDDELLALLGDENGELVIGEDGLLLTDDDDAELIAQLPEHEPLQLSDADLSGLLTAPPDISYISDKGSSRAAGERRRLRFRHLAKVNLASHPVRYARHLRLEAEAQEPAVNPLDGLSEPGLLQLMAALQQARIDVVEGEEVAIITAPITQMRGGKEMDSATRLALHLNATPVEGIVVMKMVADTRTLTRGLLEKGLAEGRDFEFIEAQSLMPYERTVFDTLLAGGKRSRLRIVRRLSKTQAKV